MSCSALQTSDAASNLPEDTILFGIPLNVIREIGRMRQYVHNGEITLIVAHDRNDRIVYKESVKLQAA